MTAFAWVVAGLLAVTIVWPIMRGVGRALGDWAAAWWRHWHR